MTKHYKYFKIMKAAKPKGRKTDTYVVVNHDGDTLATIKWHGAWHQYCIFFAGETIFSQSCLDDVGDFLRDLKEEREKKKKKRCVYGMGKGREAMCAFSLSEHHGKKTDGDPKKKPCKGCKHYTDDPRSMDEVMKDLKRDLRLLGRNQESVASAIQGIGKKKPLPKLTPPSREE